MPVTNTCAVLITYHPESAVFERLSALKSQASGIVVVDNGSGAATIEGLRLASKSIGFHLIENGENRGVAAALNIGIQWAIENRFKWIALFDQDSAIPADYLDTMWRCVASHSDSDKIAIVAPHYRDPLEDGLYISRFVAEDDAPLEIMTSGSLLPVWTFEKCGFFDEGFFIDQVDHEFSFRIRARGYRALFCEQAVIDHLPGSARRVRLLRSTWITVTDHAPARHYYQTRNGLILAKRYKQIYPLWARTIRKELLWDSPIGIIFKHSQRCRRLLYLARGVIDAYLGRFGMRVNL